MPVTPSAALPENVDIEGERQRQIQSSRQWQLVAEDMVTQLIATIQEKKLDNRPIYIHLQTKRTTFTTAFNDFLITSLVQKGIKVSTQKQGSYIYNYKIQMVEYNSFRTTISSENYKFTSLAAGLVVIRNIGDVLGVDGSILATGAALDLADFNLAPNMEVIITSSILDRNIFISRTTDIYYANRLDKHLYMPATRNKDSDVFNDSFYKMK
ncbi:MAG: hypothetical protein E6Q51_02640 [Methylophilus methylotrophus]|uniref:Uncharacterized protein n=1 Tax=Methylophilus methylotrophus TaxID=17 RepID=A0A5C7WLB4_METME|nr:MAG: hypothetical protein E6Q51_02640 [Methylophilus methylotrophus]